VLIVRPSALGDVLRTAPAVATVRRAMPEARIACLVQDGLEAALAHHPDLDEIVSFPRGSASQRWYGPTGLRELWRFSSGLRRRGFDLVIDLQGLARSGMMTWWTRAPRRIGFANARELAWMFYNRRHHVSMTMHSVDRVLTLLEAEGFAPQPDARVYIGADDALWCDGLLQEHGWSGGPFACLAPTSRWRSKCWPLERFIEVGRRLIETGMAGGRIVVLHAPSEQAYVQPLLKALGEIEAGGPSVIAPRTTVGRMMALIERCDLVVCNDSAVAHAAAGLDRPMACIFGPTDPALTGPWRRDDAVLRPPTTEGLGSVGYYRRQKDDQTLISKVSVDEVWERIGAQLAGDRAA
jgi:lipopolysaccharide heptosyltransferase I